MDQLFGIGNIVSTIYDDEEMAFYMVCNFMNDVVGLYLIKFESNNPNNHGFLIRWESKRWIADSNIHISRGVDKANGKIITYKELVVSYKSDSINTYNVIVLDLVDSSLDEKIKKGQKKLSLSILHKYECFQLWESAIIGILLKNSKNFLSFSKMGINVLALGSVAKQPIIDCTNHRKIIHSLDSLSFLKIDC